MEIGAKLREPAKLLARPHSTATEEFRFELSIPKNHQMVTGIINMILLTRNRVQKKKKYEYGTLVMCFTIMKRLSNLATKSC